MKWSKGMKRKCVNRRFTMDDIKVGTIFFGGYFDWEVTKIISGNHVAIQWTGFGTGDRKPSPNDMDGDFFFSLGFTAHFVEYEAGCPQPCYDSDCMCIHGDML